MNETPNRYGANSSEQEQWVLDGKLYSGSPAEQRQAASPSSSQQPVSSPEQAAEQEPLNRDSGNNFAAFPGNPPQNNLGEQNSFGSGIEPNVHHDFGAQNNGGNNFPQPPASQPSYGQAAGGYTGANSYPQPQSPSPAGNNFPTPPGYEGSTNWNAPSGMPQSGGPGDMGPGSFSGLSNDPVTPRPERKSQAVPIATLVLGIILMIVLAPITCIGMLVGYGVNISAGMERHSGDSVITREDDYHGRTIVLVEVPEDTEVTCKTTFNGQELISETDAGADFSADTAGSEKNNEVFSYNLHSRGKLVIDCKSAQPDKAPITAISVIPNVTFTLLVWAFILPTIMGFVGIGLLIWGIIWTVKRGRDNRQALMTNSYYR
ncbi:hypothetical protein [Varibaculum prostatecancerukia]|uniref:hypothetical protein n=1 Tax=Varibaculum prostatecancerukia TaxID=2811781 RepID=UPI001C0032CA|nr:hypothetical protein [Varibaculum prostatecancerukia]